MAESSAQHADWEYKMSFDFHKEHYERYERLLAAAQATGDCTLAREAARMILFHLKSLFQILPHSRKQAVRSNLASLMPAPLKFAVAPLPEASSSQR